MHDKLSDEAPLMTLHLHRTIGEFLEKVLLRRGFREDNVPGRRASLDEVLEYSLRYEVQDRETLHVHVVACVRSDEAVCGFEGPQRLTSRTGDGANPKSPLLAQLENVFRSCVDVQVEGVSTCLLRYVSCYVSKANDNLNFRGIFDNIGELPMGPRAWGCGPCAVSFSWGGGEHHSKTKTSCTKWVFKPRI